MKLTAREKFIQEALNGMPPKPADSATRNDKKRYSEILSQQLALAIAEELRARGLTDARPFPPNLQSGRSLAERRISGGIGAKRVDVTWATEESGLLLAISIKSINFADRRSGNFQKNLTNRRGDMLFEAVTLHRRFPFAVLGGFFFFDTGATSDGTARRNSTFTNAHNHFQLFTGRAGPGEPDEQFEHFYVCLHDPVSSPPGAAAYRAGQPSAAVGFDEALDELVAMVARRNPDFYEESNGLLRRA